jgi:hypothetical protein
MNDKGSRLGRRKLMREFVGGIRWVGATGWENSSRDDAEQSARDGANVTMAPSLWAAHMTVG